MAELGMSTLAIGAVPDEEFCGRGRIKVLRKGRYHPTYSLVFNNEEIAELRWERKRRLRYSVKATGYHLDMRIGHMQRKIRATDGDGRITKIIVASNRNLARRAMRLQMSDGDNFILSRSPVDRWGGCRFEVRKQHYLNSVLVFNFTPNDMGSPILVDVERLMRWETKHFHPILALVTARIGLEYRLNGAH
jgi:hypothetical protein